MTSVDALHRQSTPLTGSDSPIVSVRDLHVTFETSRGSVLALRGVNLDIPRGEFVGIVGESGCGKSVTGRALMGLLPRNARVSGQIALDGVDLTSVSRRDLEAIRGKRVAMIFQDPGRALNPVFTVGQQLLAVLRRHRHGSKADHEAAAIQLLRRVGLSDGGPILQTYPFQLSGGMQQRVMIAIALAGEPDLLIADEPTTALDVTIQAQILDLLAELQASRGMTVALITHDFGVIARACREVAVFYAGRVVERGSVRSVLRNPRHPYSQGLLTSLPAGVPHGMPIQTIPGGVPNALLPIEGCSFVPRCPYAHDRCVEQPPAVVVDGTTTECWLAVTEGQSMPA